MSTRLLGGIIDCEYKTSSWHLNGFPMVVTLGQQYYVGDKPTVILYTYVNRQGHHTNIKNRSNIVVVVVVVIPYAVCVGTYLSIHC